jgi:tetratricopeptide (TPR) repeat protein
LGSVQIECHDSENALNSFVKLEELFPNSIFITNQIALCYYLQTDFDESEIYFEESRAKDPFSLDFLDVYSNVLFVKDNSTKLSVLAHESVLIEKYKPETCCILGNYYSKRRNHLKAIVYFKRAIQLDSNCISAWTLMYDRNSFKNPTGDTNTLKLKTLQMQVISHFSNLTKSQCLQECSQDKFKRLQSMVRVGSGLRIITNELVCSLLLQQSNKFETL